MTYVAKITDDNDNSYIISEQINIITHEIVNSFLMKDENEEDLYPILIKNINNDEFDRVISPDKWGITITVSNNKSKKIAETLLKYAIQELCITNGVTILNRNFEPYLLKIKDKYFDLKSIKEAGVLYQINLKLENNQILVNISSSFDGSIIHSKKFVFNDQYSHKAKEIFNYIFKTIKHNNENNFKVYIRK
jgi:hypothetical protein